MPNYFYPLWIAYIWELFKSFNIENVKLSNIVFNSWILITMWNLLYLVTVHLPCRPMLASVPVHAPPPPPSCSWPNFTPQVGWRAIHACWWRPPENPRGATLPAHGPPGPLPAQWPGVINTRLCQPPPALTVCASRQYQPPERRMCMTNIFKEQLNKQIACTDRFLFMFLPSNEEHKWEKKTVQRLQRNLYKISKIGLYLFGEHFSLQTSLIL